MAKYALVIVETRELPNLCAIIDNHLDYVPNYWDLIFLGSSLNEGLIRKNYPFAKFVNLNLPYISPSAYNSILTNVNFWEELLYYNRVLIFQHDSKLLRSGIENYLKYDYVGAPWKHINLLGGNGGLSIRNPKLMRDVCNRYVYFEPIDGNEDIYFCKHLPSVGGVIAAKEEAMKFSVETIFYPTPIGIHAPEKYLSEFELNIINGNN